MDRNLALEFVRVTEAAAIAASDWIGKGDKNKADRAAVDEMRNRFNQIGFKGVVKVGEGEKDEAPQLFNGEIVGKGKAPLLDLAIDPLECTDSVAFGRYNAISVIASGEEGSFIKAPDMYMEKIAVGSRAKNVIDLDAPIDVNIKKTAKALGKSMDEITVIILDRERHIDLISKIRRIGARVRLITDGDVAGAIAPNLDDSGIDMLLGIGASAEAVLAAVAIKILGGEILARFAPQNKEQSDKLLEFRLDNKQIYRASSLAKGDYLTFTATGVIDGPLLEGVRSFSDKIITHSIVMRAKSKTIRYIKTLHHKKNEK